MVKVIAFKVQKENKPSYIKIKILIFNVSWSASLTFDALRC
jgi:hypothetical protein